MTNGISSIVVPSLPLDLVDELETISDLGFTYCSQDELDAFAATNARRRPPSPSDDSAASGISYQSHPPLQVEEGSVGSTESSSSTTSSGKKLANLRDGLVDLVRKEWEMSDPTKMIAVKRSQMDR